MRAAAPAVLVNEQTQGLQRALGTFRLFCASRLPFIIHKKLFIVLQK